MGVADARIIDLEEEKAQLEEAKAAAEAASKEAFALREKQTERIKRAKAGGPGGESAINLLPIFFFLILCPITWRIEWILLLLQPVSARSAALCRSQMSILI